MFNYRLWKLSFPLFPLQSTSRKSVFTLEDNEYTLLGDLYFIINIGVLAWKIIFLAMLGLNNLANIFRL